ncbi:MAG: two-component regulator propeller domain-containing protein [Saprospiraceae bacterium]
MRSNLLSFFSILTFLTACFSQEPGTKNTAAQFTEPMVLGDTVEELGSSIMVIYQDKNDVFWFGSWEMGVYKYDGKTLINLTTKHGLPYNRIDEIKEDEAGNLYFSSCHPKSTVSKFDGRTFTTLSPVTDNDWQLNPSDLWFRTSFDFENKVYRYNGKTLHELSLPAPPELENPFGIYSIYTDKKGNLWFGTNPVGVCRYDGKSFDWITEEDVTEFRDEGANGVRSIAEDKNGDFWFNTEYRYSIYDSFTLNGQQFYN